MDSGNFNISTATFVVFPTTNSDQFGGTSLSSRRFQPESKEGRKEGRKGGRKDGRKEGRKEGRERERSRDGRAEKQRYRGKETEM